MTAFKDKRARNRAGNTGDDEDDIIQSDVNTKLVWSRQSVNSTICKQSHVSRHKNPSEFNIGKASVRFKAREMTTEKFVKTMNEMSRVKVKGYSGPKDYTMGVLDCKSNNNIKQTSVERPF